MTNKKRAFYCKDCSREIEDPCYCNRCYQVGVNFAVQKMWEADRLSRVKKLLDELMEEVSKGEIKDIKNKEEFL